MPIPRQCRRHITRFFESITPEQRTQYYYDWLTIIPQSDIETLNRWRFAYCTVHTPWLRSCEQYQKIQNLYDNIEYTKLAEILKKTSGGMWDIKAEGIDQLHRLWRNDDPIFEPTPNWQKFRNNLYKSLPKLGLAKTSFALEMLYPNTAQIICIDRHMFKAFGWEDVDLSCNENQYHYYENYWVDMSNQYNMPPVLSRNLFWDIIQQQTSSLYWAKYL